MYPLSSRPKLGSKQKKVSDTSVGKKQSRDPGQRDWETEMKNQV